MEVFVVAANAGSFAAASAQLGMSAQMVARHVQALEQRLKVRLLNRTTRRQSLTEFGRLYHERCLELLAAVDAADSLATELHAEPHGRLRVSAPHQFGSQGLMKFVSEFMARYPKIEMDLSLCDRAVNIIEEGFEAVFRIGELGFGDSSSLVVRPLRCYQMIACASPAYLKAHGTPSHPLDLQRHQCLGYVFWDRMLYDEWEFAKAGERFKVRIKGRMQVNDATAQLNAALNGMGVLLGAEDLVAESLLSGRLIQVLPDYRAPYEPMHLIYPADQQRSIKLRSFIEAAMAAFGETEGDATAK